MGGPGSGRRWDYGARPQTDDYDHLDVRQLQREGLLIPDRVFSLQWTRAGRTVAVINVWTATDRVFLSYRCRTSGGEWRPVEYPVRLDWTPCNYGGQRVWFICPSRGCGRRVAVLYGGSIFACRHCQRLAYSSQRETAGDRALRRAQAIRKKLGGSANMTLPFPWKPKGMRWNTYEQLRLRHDALYRISLADMLKRLGK